MAHLYPSNPKAENLSKYFDRQTYIQIVRTIQTLIQVTPFKQMRPGLGSITVQALIDNLHDLDKMNNRDQLIRNEICSAINSALIK